MLLYMLSHGFRCTLEGHNPWNSNFIQYGVQGIHWTLFERCDCLYMQGVRILLYLYVIDKTAELHTKVCAIVFTAYNCKGDVPNVSGVVERTSKVFNSII